jgi:D-alanyl-D-alanine dipeptidase
MRALAAVLAGLLLALPAAPAHAAEGEKLLVDIREVDPTILLDIKYATADNFMGEVLYDTARCFLRPQVAARLARAQTALRERGLGLKIFDGYRPHSVQVRMFERYPFPGYVADPKTGSNHNRGAAVDVGLVDASGRELAMPSKYDEFSERSHLDYAGGTEEERRNRAVLQDAMRDAGFMPITTEWWHFNDPDAASYAVLDVPLREAAP